MIGAYWLTVEAATAEGIPFRVGQEFSVPYGKNINHLPQENRYRIVQVYPQHGVAELDLIVVDELVTA